MKEKFIAFVLFAMVCTAGILFYARATRTQETNTPQSAQEEKAQPKENVFDGKNALLDVEGKFVLLKNGFSEMQISTSSAAKITTKYFGNEATGDLNGDGLKDTAFLITQDTGGSGLFYYAVAAMNKGDGYEVTNAFFVGDRIAPQSTNINESAGELYVNFAERKPDEPMSATPSQGATLYLKVTPKGVLEGLMK